MHYLDNAATTAVLPQVAQAVNEALLQGWANPSSLYRAGAGAEAALGRARAVLAKALGCAPGEVYFTSGGTEADNIAVLGAARARRGWAARLVTSGYEHPAVSGPLALLKAEGYALTTVAPGQSGRLNPEELAQAVDKKTALLCAMHVNNETGAVTDVAALACAAKANNPRCFVHVDGVQAFCKLPVGPTGLAGTLIDSYAISAHKLHGPKGIGALYLRRGSGINPPLAGGGQQQGIRPGTENTAGAAGFAKAVEIAWAHREAHARQTQRLHGQLLAGLARLEGVRVLSPSGGLPGILMVAMPKGMKSQVMLNYLDENYQICVSSGSACKLGAPSHTLRAMGLPEYMVDAALRVSFDGYNTGEDIAAFLEGLETGLARLARAR